MIDYFIDWEKYLTFRLPVIQLIQYVLLHICCQSNTPYQCLELVKAIIEQSICPLSYINMAPFVSEPWVCGENKATGM